MNKKDNAVILMNELQRIKKREGDPTGLISQNMAKLTWYQNFKVSNVRTIGLKKIAELEGELALAQLGVQGEDFLRKTAATLDAHTTNLVNYISADINFTAQSILKQTTANTKKLRNDFVKEMMALKQEIEEDELYKQNPTIQASELADLSDEMHKTLKRMKESSNTFRDKISDGEDYLSE